MEKLLLLLQYILPHHSISRLVGFFANSHNKLIKNAFIWMICKKFNVDLSEAIEANPYAYRSFNDFFTRTLTPQARPIVAADNELACPVDGFVSQIGDINQQQLFQAKGHHYDLTTLLGGEAELAEPFINGKFATLYLAPKDYHRVHMPITGTLKSMTHVPGKLFSVGPAVINNVANVFARNERVVCLFDTAIGPMAMILVGAMIVASIETQWAGLVTPPTNDNVEHWHYAANQIKLHKGEEMGLFKMGSTVIVLFTKDTMTWSKTLAPEQHVKMGQLLGVL